MDIQLFKIISAVTIFGVGLVGGYFASVLRQSSRSALLFSLGNALAGGVFLGAAMIHLLPDAQDNFSTAFGNYDYPWISLAVIVGLMTILFLEKVLAGGHHHGPHGEESKKSSMILLLILSVHSIITGIALGIEAQIVQAGVILLAILAHKGAAAFALGISMLKASLERKSYRILIVVFSTTTPIGILAGAIAGSQLTGRDAALFEGIFDALAAGTFLYISLFEILQEEFRVHTSRWAKFGTALLGVAIMAVVAIWT